MDCSPPGSSVHGIFQARVLEWGAIAFSDWSSEPHIKLLKQILNCQVLSATVYCIVGQEDFLHIFPSSRELKISKDGNCNEMKCIKNVAISELKERRERGRREGEQGWEEGSGK